MTADIKSQSRSLISPTSVEGTAVFNRAGERLGSIYTHDRATPYWI